MKPYGQKIYTVVDGVKIEFETISKAADLIVSKGLSQGGKHTVIAKILECINPELPRKNAYGLYWYCDNFQKETKNKSPIAQYTQAGKFVAQHPSAIEAARALSSGPIQAGHIREVCKRQRNTALGYVWKYV